jgi:periplasmic protein CpxP/Spy
MLTRQKIKKTIERQKLMKCTKTTVIAALAVGSLLALSPALRADDTTNSAPANAPEGQHAHNGFDRMSEKLNLTDDQKSKVQAILKDQMEKIRNLRQDTDLSREDRMAKMKTIHEDTATQLKAVLTADQFAQWQKMTQKRMHRQMKKAPGDENNDATTNAPSSGDN